MSVWLDPLIMVSKLFWNYHLLSCGNLDGTKNIFVEQSESTQITAGAIYLLILSPPDSFNYSTLKYLLCSVYLSKRIVKIFRFLWNWYDHWHWLCSSSNHRSHWCYPIHCLFSSTNFHYGSYGKALWLPSFGKNIMSSDKSWSIL